MSNQLKVRAGKLIVNAGHQISTECAATGCCICVDCLNQNSLQITGYNPSLFSAGSCSFLPAGSQPAWDGTGMTYRSEFGCFWSITGKSINGWLFSQISITLDNEQDGCWFMYFQLFQPTSIGYLWQGKHEGDSPIGVYTRVSSDRSTGATCSPGPATLTVATSTAAIVPTVPACYKLNHYTPGDITGCGQLQSGGTAWDGTFPKYVSGGTEGFPASCLWRTDPSVAYVLKVNNPSLPPFVNFTVVSFLGWRETNTGDGRAACLWWMDIVSTDSTTLIWRGFKSPTLNPSAGSNPAGVYAKTAGCDGNSALTVVAC